MVAPSRTSDLPSSSMVVACCPDLLPWRRLGRRRASKLLWVEDLADGEDARRLPSAAVEEVAMQALPPSMGTMGVASPMSATVRCCLASPWGCRPVGFWGKKMMKHGAPMVHGTNIYLADTVSKEYAVKIHHKED
ncbi:hypothetical protein ACLOJK_003751 [Asimina triloba]